ncbi:lipopolysaccharide biosynthesis protein [Croceivirga thetidis]|uniref:Polysaccharide biosynthesis protein n=1 Tax=Croceivirga thetidis TaxID=2721623 RepID=A0ABX1GQ35_9FLAO|nr:MATE family efflux transporter [Croceivirga thetidis]NKI31196.1 hypothetical protein [Croceivirga thetidis]
MPLSKQVVESNKRYTSGKVLKKAVFNLGFQIVPIIVALVFIPLIINNLGKDYWAKYTAGVSAIFLANYFSFGIGPALNRRVSELIGAKKMSLIDKEVNTGIGISYLLSAALFLLFTCFIILAYWTKSLSILQDKEDLLFFLIIGFSFFIVFISIPYKSLLESYSDFYFLAIIRAISSAGLFVVPYVLWLNGISKLYWVGISLVVYYFLVFLFMFFRTQHHKKELDLCYKTSVKPTFLISSTRSNTSFIKEAFKFGVFFLCSATVLFFDRYFYALFVNTKTLSDHVTMLDLFNRIAIVTGTISLVYFSAISVWYSENNFVKIKKNLRFQLTLISILFVFGLIFCKFFLLNLMEWWLKGAYSEFITNSAFVLLLAILIMNFEILMVRPLQAIGKVTQVNRLLVATTIIFLIIVIVLGMTDNIRYHYIALITKGIIDCFFLFGMLRNEKLI